MYSNILIPVLLDASRNAERAFEAATTLANPTAALTLLHVVEMVPAYATEFIPPDVLKSTRASLQAQVDEMAARLPNCRGVLVDGRPGQRIARWAEENGNDCIVIASHEPAFSDILLGSVAHHVVRHSKCAVHVVR